MAESLAGAAEEAAEGIGKIVVDVGGKISITISSTSAQSVRDVCITAVTLGAIYAGIGFYSTVKTSGLRPSVFTVE